jgi:hypothetical protein
MVRRLAVVVLSMMEEPRSGLYGLGAGCRPSTSGLGAPFGSPGAQLAQGKRGSGLGARGSGLGARMELDTIRRIPSPESRIPNPGVAAAVPCTCGRISPSCVESSCSWRQSAASPTAVSLPVCA